MRFERGLEVVLWCAAALLLALGTDFGAIRADGYRLRPKSSGSMRVVTWNIGGAQDGTPQGFQRENVPAVADTLAKLGADIACLQEIGDLGLVDELLAALGPPWRVLRGRGDTVILTSSPMVERLRTSQRCENSAGARFRLGSSTVALFGVHAHAFSSSARNRQIGAAIDDLMEQRGVARMFVGDLNLDLDLDKKSDLFTDDQQADVESYNYVAKRMIDAARGAGATAEPDRRLDYVFVSSGIEVLAAGPFRGQRRGTMDHDPVVADVRCP